MDITEVKIYPFDTSEAGGKTMAMAQITIGGVLVIKGFRIIAAKGGGVFVSFPSVKGKDGKWRDIVSAVDPDTKEAVRKAALDAFHKYEGPPVDAP